MMIFSVDAIHFIISLLKLRVFITKLFEEKNILELGNSFVDIGFLK